MKLMTYLGALLLAGSLSLGGCAGTAPPTEQMRVSKAAVTGAENTGAQRLAPVEFRSAQEKIKQAEAAMENEEYEKARRFAEEAEVDARLAEVKSRRVKTQKAAEELKKSIEILQQEIDRNR